MWIAREANGLLRLYTEKPTRRYDEFWYLSDTSDCITLPKKLYPHLTWEDEPIEVNLVEVNPKHKMTCPHCCQMIEYTNKDIKTSYDCQPSSSLPDNGEDYITCPNCGKTIDL